MTPQRGLALAERSGLAAEVVEYLQRTPRQLPSRLLYDALGSALFDAICHLPWYHVTRAETALLERHGAQMLAGLPHPLGVAELGGGNGEKLAVLLAHTQGQVERLRLIDISSAALDHASQRLAAFHMPISTFNGTYEDGLARLAGWRGRTPWLVLCLGSNIGNFDPPAARAFLRRIRQSLRPGDALLLGTDLVKPERDLLLAYDDPLQVTAAFNRNLLVRLNRDLGATFDLAGFSHRAVWDARRRRVEMHLVSTQRQTVRIADADLEIRFEPDESIWTESSCKWDSEAVAREGETAGFTAAGQWIDGGAGFALTRFVV
ncbi:MAG: L-histidine N(alpha)-methyltransferase [Vicinamibacterales bacterium]